MKYALCCIVAACVVTMSSSAAADPITNHAVASTWLNDGQSGQQFGVWSAGQANAYSDSFSPYYSGASAVAFASPNSASLLHAYASAYGSHAYFFFKGGAGTGKAAWRDIAYATSGTPPAAIRLNFNMHGILDAVTTFPEVGEVFTTNFGMFAISLSTNPLAFFDGSTLAGEGVLITSTRSYSHSLTAAVYDGYYYADGFYVGGLWSSDSQTWDSYTWNGSEFLGTFHLDIPFDPTLNGYGFGIALDAIAEGKGGSASADALGTLGIRSVTLLDGTPIDVRFDSGLSLAAPSAEVPEVTSAIAWCCTMLAWAACRRWRANLPVSSMG